MKTLILGAGEVGNSLKEVLQTSHETHISDIDPIECDNIDVLNICFPAGKTFVETVAGYIKLFRPKVTIVHSTVPVGTIRCISLAANTLAVVHSPVHGVHPNLAKGLVTFKKYVGGLDPSAVALAVVFLTSARIPAFAVTDAETAELSKLLCTTYYAWNVIFCKEVAAVCNKHEVDFTEVYTNWNLAYNEGYEKLGMPHVRRPVLAPTSGDIGGHCLIPNAKLLPCWVTKHILKRNKRYGKL